MLERYDLSRALDDAIEDAVAFADPMVLRGLLFQFTGDESVANVKVDTQRFGVFDQPFVPDPEDVAFLRARAIGFLKAARDSGRQEFAIGPRERLQTSLGLCVGAEVDDNELDLWIQESGLDMSSRGIEWSATPDSQRMAAFSVVVIGAGMGGLNVAAHLARAGVSFALLEKNSGVGGTWYENRYPGARVDTPSRTYSHTFGVRFPKSGPFCVAAENEKYLNWIADRFGLWPYIELDTEVQKMVWDEQAAEWVITASVADGERVLRANVVISAVGFLSRPNIPPFKAQDSFSGRVFHTARWPSDIDLKGKRVAVIGSGCTGYQMVPELAKISAHIDFFQRTPSWVFDLPGYLSSYPVQVVWLDSHFPYYAHFSRLITCWSEGPRNTMPMMRRDMTFDDPHAVSALNKRVRDQRVEYMSAKFATRPDLLAKMLPDAPPLSSRPVLVDADNNIYDVLLRDDVTLVSESIDRFTSQGIRTVDGREYKVDAIVLATGFKANDFLWPIQVQGRGGTRLEDVWARDGARAYISVMVPSFPNLFMMYGPNGNPAGGIGVPCALESAGKFALECIAYLIQDGKRAVDVRHEAFERFNLELDRAEVSKVYSDPRANSYWTTGAGRSASQQPFDVRLYWSWLRSPDGSKQVPKNSWALDWQGPPIRPHIGEDLIVD